MSVESKKIYFEVPPPPSVVVSNDFCEELTVTCFQYTDGTEYGFAVSGQKIKGISPTFDVNVICDGTSPECFDEFVAKDGPIFDSKGDYQENNNQINNLSGTNQMSGDFYLNFEVKPCTLPENIGMTCVPWEEKGEIEFGRFIGMIKEATNEIPTTTRGNIFYEAGASILPVICSLGFLAIGVQIASLYIWNSASSAVTSARQGMANQKERLSEINQGIKNSAGDMLEKLKIWKKN